MGPQMQNPGWAGASRNQLGGWLRELHTTTEQAVQPNRPCSEGGAFRSFGDLASEVVARVARGVQQ